mgnify:CR=1 FL=1
MFFPEGLVVAVPILVIAGWAWITDPHRKMKQQARREIKWITSQKSSSESLDKSVDDL